jgi:formate-dependent nitrite reductase cytochrome c552 subunit
MANYYHEARAEKRAIKEKTEANKRKAERRAELAGVEVGSSMHVPCCLRRQLLCGSSIRHRML